MSATKTKDMTQGNPLSLILRFSIPLVLGNLFQQLYNLVDTIIVGRTLGLEALTAVGATGSLNFLVLGFVIGTSNGLSIPIAQSFGAKDYKEMRKYMINDSYLALFFAIFIGTLTTIFCKNILMFMKTPQNIFDMSYAYFVVICLGIPFTYLYNTVSGMIRAMGDSKTPFYFLVVSTALNILLDLLFIVVFHMGVAGAAWATILAQGISGIVCVIYMIQKYEIVRPEKDEKKIYMRYIRRLFVNSVPMGLQFSITAIGAIMLQSAINVLDAVYVSAYAGALKIKQLAMCPFDAIASASATFGEQNLGAGKIERVDQGLYSGIKISLIYGVLIGIVLFTNGSKIAWLFIDPSETEVLDALQQFMNFQGMFFWSLAILNVTRMMIQALGYSGISMFAGFSELLARGAMSLFVIPVLGYSAVCFTDMTAWFSAICVVVPVYIMIRRRLKKKLTK